MHHQREPHEIEPAPQPVVVEFPLRGEWVAPTTPGRRVPSHGTDMLGQRYAYDFLRTDPSRRGMCFSRVSLLHYMVVGTLCADCYGWGQPIYSPVAGEVVVASDGWPERRRLHPAKDQLLALRNALTFSPSRLADLRPLCGNHIIVETEAGFAFFAHARPGSVRVFKGAKVEVGDHLAEVGHTGNSTAPHLHFQMADGLDLFTARGIPCCFREYEVWRDCGWATVKNGIPRHTERIRLVDRP